MKIILSFPRNGAADSYFINSLQNHGIEIIAAIDHRAMGVHAAQELLHQILISRDDIDYVFVAYLNYGYTYTKDFINYHKGKVKFISFFFDTVIDNQILYENKNFIDLMLSYDVSFFVVEQMVNEMCKFGINAKFMRMGFDTTQYIFSGLEKKYNISFIGQFGYNIVHTSRITYLDRICNKYNDIIIVGNGGNITNNIAKNYIFRETLNSVEFARIVAMSKINFGLTDWGRFKQQDGYSDKVYQIMGFGGFLLYNYLPMLASDFIDGKEIVLYRDIDDCIDKIEFYLSHDSDRESITQSGKDRVLRDYTWDISMQNILRQL